MPLCSFKFRLMMWIGLLGVLTTRPASGQSFPLRAVLVQEQDEAFVIESFVHVPCIWGFLYSLASDQLRNEDEDPESVLITLAFFTEGRWRSLVDRGAHAPEDLRPGMADGRIRLRLPRDGGRPYFQYQRGYAEFSPHRWVPAGAEPFLASLGISTRVDDHGRLLAPDRTHYPASESEAMRTVLERTTCEAVRSGSEQGASTSASARSVRRGAYVR